jgi:glycine oxidase
MTTPAPADLVVVGGGVIGLAVAWRAASAGMAVTVVDPDPGRGASWAAAGMLGPVGEAHFGEDALTRLNVVAARSWPDFAHDLEAASGRSVHYRTGGTLLVAADASDRAATDDVLRYQLALGLAARRLTSAECRAAEPLLAPGIRGGVDLAEDHQVDNRQVVEALLEACRAGGVSFVADEVAEVTTDARGVTGVALRWGGRLGADSVVLAAGCHSGQVGGVPEPHRPPVRPVKGLTIRLRALDGTPRLQRTLRGLVRGRSCYLVPRSDGTVVVGATVEEKGFDLTVQAGSVVDLLDDARRLIPAIDEYELRETTTGLRPGSPDNAPIVGSTGLPGLIVATGHYRNGILLAPITAGEVVRLLGVQDTAAPSGTPSPSGSRGSSGTTGTTASGSSGTPEADGDRRHGTFAAFGPQRFGPGPESARPGAPDATLVDR